MRTTGHETEEVKPGYPKMAGLENKVRKLLDLLDEVERGFQAEPDSVTRELAFHLLGRLENVADVVSSQVYNEESDQDQDDNQPPLQDRQLQVCRLYSS